MDEFAADPERLRQVAEAITTGHRADQATASEGTDADVDETDFPEGRVIYRLHCARARNAKLLRKRRPQFLQRPSVSRVNLGVSDHNVGRIVEQGAGICTAGLKQRAK